MLSAVPAGMVLMAGGMKLAQGPGLAEGFTHMGWRPEVATSLGVLEVVCVALYVTPRTAVLGAIFLTGLLGGATATHLRVGDPFFIQPLLGAMAWGGLYMRDERVRALLPFVTR